MLLFRVFLSTAYKSKDYLPIKKQIPGWFQGSMLKIFQQMKNQISLFFVGCQHNFDMFACPNF
jgi:hypothetical protein